METYHESIGIGDVHVVRPLFSTEALSLSV